MLKYLDIARLVGAGIKCPACNGTHYRQSNWHSKEEKLRSDGYRPYRCDDCANRFLAARSASVERTLINSAAGVLLVLGALTVAELWLGSYDDPTTEGVVLASMANSEESAAEHQGDIVMQHRTGKTVSDPKAPPESPADKIDRLRKAAEDGHAESMVQLGRLLATGEKIPKDVGQAAKWVQLAASTGYPEGMFELGRFYRDGMGLAQNSVRAYVWFSRAAAANHLDAMQERDDLVLTMSDEKLKEARRLSLAAEPDGDTGRRK
ncbi:MAG TPA: tetratricopeptide repeat protein [Rhodocyclaceae bacterium]|nr:tetratricopeptide repeat protein [Rhodocyclaceae bacterium]